MENNYEGGILIFKFKKKVGHTLTVDAFVFNTFVSKFSNLNVRYRETIEPDIELGHEDWYTFMIKCTDEEWSLLEYEAKYWKERGHVLRYH